MPDALDEEILDIAGVGSNTRMVLEQESLFGRLLDHVKFLMLEKYQKLPPLPKPMPKEVAAAYRAGCLWGVIEALFWVSENRFVPLDKEKMEKKLGPDWSNDILKVSDLDGDPFDERL